MNELLVSGPAICPAYNTIPLGLDVSGHSFGSG